MKKGLVMLIFLMTACSSDDGEAPVVIPDTEVANSSFERDGESQTISEWESQGDVDADFTISGGQSGKYSLSHKKDVPYQVSTSQEVMSLENGYYSLIVYAKNSGGQKSCFIAAKDQGEERITSLPVATANWVTVIVRGIHVTTGKCVVGIYSDANAGNWCKVDSFDLIKDDKPFSFLKGGDISELSYIEQMGGKFYENGIEKDGLEILADNGMNLARLRLYNDPGNPDFTPSKQLPAGIQDPEDILRLAKRAKDLGMQIQLTFHYSDYWTNGGLQTKPHEWAALSYDELKQTIYDYTFDFMTRMKDQGTTPEYVSIGNEIAGGILFPEGASNNFAKLAELLNRGYEAVKAVAPDSKVVIHLDDAGNADKYDWFFGELKSRAVNYDIIGASYYPFWTDKTVSQIISWANYTTSKFNKDILIMETGYNWNPVASDGWQGQLTDNGPYDGIYASSPSGQRDFLYETFNGLKLVSGGRVIGDIYWDPVMIAVEGVGWELGGRNAVDNTTLFDFDGNALPALKAFKYNN